MRILEMVEFMIDQTAKPRVSDLYDLYQGLSHQTFIIQNKEVHQDWDTDFRGSLIQDAGKVKRIKAALRQ